MSRKPTIREAPTAPPPPQYEEEETGSANGEQEELEEAEDDQDGYTSSTPTSTLTWISWFCSLPGHEYFCEVAEEFIEDDFNLTGLNAMVPFFREALEMVLDVETDEDSSKIPDVSIVEASAEVLYGLVHQRYIITRSGLQAMADKYENGMFGSCPRVYCSGTNVVPCGRYDVPGMDTVKLFCPNCCDIYGPPSSRFQGIDGAYFGTTFAHVFFHTYRELAPAPFWKSPGGALSPARSPRAGGGAADAPAFVNPNPHGGQKRPAGRIYTPRIYGFRVSERARSGPRMQWLRLRPETAEELELVDWRGRWLDEEEDEDEYEDPDGEDGEMEDFDPEGAAGDDDDDDEEEEEDDAPPAKGGATGRMRADALPSPASTGPPVTPRDPMLAPSIQAVLAQHDAQMKTKVRAVRRTADGIAYA